MMLRTVCLDELAISNPVLLELAENRGGDVGVTLARLAKLTSESACLNESCNG